MGKKSKLTLKGAALIVMSSIIVSRITGFLRELLVPNMIGVDEVGEAYTIAFKITGSMYELLVSGAISSALIPVLSGYIAKDEEEEGWKAVGTFMNIAFIMMIVLCALGMIFTPQIVMLIARGFKSEYQRTLAVKLTRILFPSACFFMLAGFSNGILNSYNKFAVASYGPCIYNIGCILSIYFFSNMRGGICWVVYGVTLSSFVYCTFQMIFASRNMKFYKPKIFWGHEGFRKLFKLAIPSMISSSIIQVNELMSGSFSTLFKSGAVAFNIANRVWQMPYGVFAQGIATAILPSLSAKLAAGKVDEFRKTWIKSLRITLFLTIPSAVGFVVLKKEIMTIFKFTKKFSDEFVGISANALMYFSIALIAQSLVLMITRAFYANNDTKTPLYIQSTSIVLNFVLSYSLYKYTALGVAGMALANSVTSVVNAIVLFVVFNRRTGGLINKDVLKFCQKTILCSLFMGLTIVIVRNFLPDVGGSKILQLISLGISIGTGVVVYFVSVWIAKVEEAQEFVKTLVEKVKPSRT